jgi:xanthine dehydrogenase YagR molybdenum-binding subunit
VTGQAVYAAEPRVPGLTYGVVVSSTIARGRVREIHTDAALALEGVVHVFTHENRLRLRLGRQRWTDDVAPDTFAAPPECRDPLQWAARGAGRGRDPRARA